MLKYYVTWTDRFMSGWGRARGKTNRCYLGPYKSYEYAYMVYDYVKRHARDHAAQNVRLGHTRPKKSAIVLVSHLHWTFRRGRGRLLGPLDR